MRSGWRWAVLATATVILAFMAAAVLLYAPRRTAPDVQVASLALKGLAWDEAAVRLGLAERTTVAIWTLDGAVFDIPVRLELDVEATLREVFELGRTGGLWERLSQWRDLQGGQALPGIWRAAAGETERVSAALASLAQAEPVDAALRHEGDRVWVEPGRRGRRLDEGALAAQVAEVAEGRTRFAVPTRPVAPAVTTADIEAWGVSALRGKMTTYYDAANRSRTNNIIVSSQAVRAVLLAPGERFSFNERVGPRTVERGYQVANVILSDALVPGLGGGICQVSSTIYAAAVMAGMAVVERANHSLPIWYMEPAMDATVSWGGPDLVLRNDTGAHLLLTVASDQQGATTVRIFGAPGGGAQLESVVLSRSTPPLRTVFDPNLAPGEVVVEQPGQDGLTAALYRVADGERTLVNHSHYLAHPRRIRVGPDAAPLDLPAVPDLPDDGALDSEQKPTG